MIRSPTTRRRPAGGALELLEQARLGCAGCAPGTSSARSYSRRAAASSSSASSGVGWPAAQASAAAAYGSSPHAETTVSSGAMPGGLEQVLARPSARPRRPAASRAASANAA